jgi:hypothetical protein
MWAFDVNLRLALAAPLLAAAAVLAMHAPTFAQGAPLKGEVLEARDVDGYTYLRLKTGNGEVWAAVPKSALAKGAKVTIVNPMTMRDFESKTLQRKFDSIVFGQLAATDARSASPHGQAPATGATAIRVAKASGPDGKTVAEVIKGKASLSGKPVIVHGQVVKISKGIMGKNWLHLQDGSGSSGDGTHDIVVTTKDVAAVGDVVNVKGIVRTNVDIGSGYNYPVLIEDASVRK